ncbi:MAG: M56 family metallopeptidase [Mycolicibacterium sp.]|nr:M56 family metallopeptidase [Mycobacterium sp.]MCB0946149.1 M56 family metallopeptidase [Mycobacterium sp.]MCB9416028.1 M56 family metallopeptidase [Mycolicibacterium sp.]
MSALAFALVALLLVGPVPALLARAAWPLRAPRAAIVLWQSIAVAAVLSAFSAGLAIASRLFVPGPDGRPTATITSEIAVLGWPLWLTYILVFALTLLIGGRLAMAAVEVAVATRRRRAHHRMVVDLLGECPHGTPGLRVLHVAEPLAYCLPGVRSRVVLSEGTLSALTDTEVAAILSHERAHLRARHDLVLEAFIAVHTAFPRFVRSGSALNAVRLLVELLADDAAVRTAGPTPLARALVACASARTPRGALAAGGPTTVLRVQRLAGRPNSLLLALAAYAAAAAVLVLPTIAVAVPWLTELHRLFFG